MTAPRRAAHHPAAVRALPGGMRYEPVLQVWRRGADGETAPPLVFPGDESLIAAKLLNEDDFPMFEKLVIMFDEAGKPQRDRVLAAIAKVFG